MTILSQLKAENSTIKLLEPRRELALPAGPKFLLRQEKYKKGG